MSFGRSNNKMVISLLTLLTFLMVVTNTYYYNKMSEAEEEVEKLEEEVEKLEESERVKENEISNLKEKLNETENENQKLKEELEKYENLRKLNIVATAYDAFCDTGCIGLTATGYDVSNTVYKDGYRIISVDPNVIPLGSLVYVESDKMNFVGIADDTGGDIKGNRIDILMENRDKAYDFGRRNVKVTVLREGSG